MLLPDAPVSIDIGSFSVKVAQLRGGRGGVRSIRYAEQRLPSGFHWEPGGDAAPLLEAIRQALRRAGIRSRRALIALSRRHVIARISAFPPADRAQLQRIIEVDLADHIPFPVEQVVVDFQALGPSLEQPGMVDVLVVAAQRDLVRQHLELARALGMRVAALTVDSFALHDLVALRQESAPGVTLALEIGRRATTINVSEAGRLRLTRAIPLGSMQLTAALRDDLGVSTEEAEVRRLTDGLRLLGSEPRPARTAAWVDNLRGEMRRTALSFGQAPITRICLAGAAAHTPGLAEALHAEFGLAPVMLSPISLFPTAQLRGSDPSEADRCLLAIGQGLRALGRSTFTVSLVPREVAAQRRQTALQRLAVVAALALAGLLTMSYLSTKRQVAALHGEDARLAATLAETEKKAEQAKQLSKSIEKLKGDLSELEPARARRYAALELLRTVSESADPKMILTKFALRPEQPLTLSGTAPNPAAAADLQASLLRSPLVSRVSLSGLDRFSQSQYLSIPRRRGPGGPRFAAPQAPPETAATDERVNFTLTVHLWSEKTTRARRSLAAALEESR